MNTLKGKKVVLTGGNRGIGRSIALSFAKAGADVFLTYCTDENSAQTVANEIEAHQVAVKTIQVDLSCAEDRQRLLIESYAFFGDVDILVNNAGIATRRPFIELSQEEINKVVEINFLAPCFLMQLFAKRMVQQQTQRNEHKDYCIVNISSISRNVITPGISHYEASKAALNQITKSAAIELAEYKIRVNDVAPGLIPTEINREQWETHSPLWQNRIAAIPLQRSGKPEEIADAVLFLAGNSWITVTTITVDGGRSCNWSGSER